MASSLFFSTVQTFWNRLTMLNASCVTWALQDCCSCWHFRLSIFTNCAHYQTIITLVFSIDNVSLSCSTTRLLNITICLSHVNMDILFPRQENEMEVGTNCWYSQTFGNTCLFFLHKNEMREFSLARDLWFKDVGSLYPKTF